MIMSAREVVRAGLLHFPASGESYPGRKGGVKDYVINTRGAGALLELRGLIVTALAASALEVPAFDTVGGVAKAGTAWGAWLAWALDKPFANILLDGPRASGLRREVEGDIAGRRVLIVDNWTRSGASLRAAAIVVERAGGITAGALTIVRHAAADIGFPLRSPWTVQALLTAARELGLWNGPPDHPDLQH